MIALAEQLADTQPDSTVSLIDSVLRMPANLSERQRMDMALLQAEALFGCRDGARTVSPVMDDDFFDEHAPLSTSPDLERAAAYFAKKKQYAKAAHAALYSGFVQQHYNEKEDAMKSFKEAEQYGGLAVDSLSMAQAQYWMGKMLYNEGREQEALYSLLASKSFIGNCYGERALIENSMAVAYILMGQNDSAELCLQQSVIFAEKGHSEKVRRKITNNYSVLYRIQGKYDRAIDCLQQMLVDANPDKNEIFMTDLNLGNVYFDMKEIDSAAKYYQRVGAILSTVNIKKETIASSYGALSSFAEFQNNASLALQYREKHERVLYDLMLQRQEQTIYRIQQQFDYESLQNEMNKKIIKRHVIILIISVLLFISTMIVLVLRYRHKQLLESEKEMRQQMDAMKQDLLQTVKISVLDHEISSRLRTILLAQRTIQRAKDPQKEWQSLVIQIMNKKQDPFEAARSVLETAYPNLYSTILENHPDLTETEAKICLLSCSDLSNAEMAEFLGLRLNTVNQNRSNLRKKLNLKPDGMKEQLRMAFSK